MLCSRPNTMTRTRILEALFLVVAGASAYYLGGVFSDRSVTPPASVDAQTTVGGLFVEPRELVLGEVQETDRHIVRFEIRNTTSRSKKITEFRGSCGCAAIEPREMTLPGGEVGQFPSSST